MDKIGFSWYPHFQRLLLLYYLLTCSLGCKDKLCGFFCGQKDVTAHGRRSPSSLRRPADGSRVAMQSQLEVGSGVKGTRNCEVVQCFKRIWFHPTANGGRRFRALLRDHDGRL